jgi:anti-sigma regulatory factor (Ser/Thr protein kinase)
VTITATVLEAPGEGHAHHLARGIWPPPTTAEIHMKLRMSATAPARARAAAADLLAPSLGAGQPADVALMLSELVTNAISYPPADATATVGLYLAVAPERIRAEICDSGGGFAPGPLSAPPASGLSGRELLIVDRLATRWGADADDRHSVWFELDR